MLLHCRGTEEGDSLGSRDQRLKYQCQTEALAEGRQSIIWSDLYRGGEINPTEREKGKSSQRDGRRFILGLALSAIQVL